MLGESVSDQRRQHERAPIAVSAAAVRDGSKLGQFRAVNISANGALFLGARPVEVGEEMTLTFSLPTGELIRTPALVIREGRQHDRTVFAVVFLGVAAGDQQAIQTVVAAALEEMRKAYVVFVDRSEQTCRNLRERAQRCGFASFAVTSVMDAIQVLEIAARVRTAIVNLYLGADDGRELLKHLASKQPGVRRILMSTTLSRFDLLDATATMTVGAPHAVLTGAFTTSDFKLALVG